MSFPDLTAAAYRESRRRGDPFYGTEHLLIAVAEAKPLVDRGIDAARLREEVDRTLGPSTLPFKPPMVGPTQDAAAALEAAEEVARRRGSDPTVNDLFAALLGREGDAPTVATAVLEALGLSIDELRRETRGQ
jgi:hypothetical protein